MIRRAALITSLLFPLITWTGYQIFGGPSISDILTKGPLPLWLQLGWGAIIGLAFYGMIYGMLTTSRMQPVRHHYNRLFRNVPMSMIDLVGASLLAALTEELFFRGWLQYHIGIIPTAIIFIGIHGYYYQRGVRGIFMLGVALTVFAVVLGYLYEYAGYGAAVSAHLIYNMGMFWWVRTSIQRAHHQPDRSHYMQMHGK